MDRRKRLHTSNPFWADENADVVETAMVEIDTDVAEYREIGGAEAPDGQQGLKGADEVSGHEEIEGHQSLITKRK